jgi:hypothetical protein
VVLLVPVVGDAGVVDTVEQGRPSHNKMKQMIQLTQGLSMFSSGSSGSRVKAHEKEFKKRL